MKYELQLHNNRLLQNLQYLFYEQPFVAKISCKYSVIRNSKSLYHVRLTLFYERKRYSFIDLFQIELISF